MFILLNYIEQTSFLFEVLSALVSGILLALLFFFCKENIYKRNNLSGKWKMYDSTHDSSYNTYIGMKLISNLSILQNEKNIVGSGEKVSEVTIKFGEKNYTPKEKITFSFNGSFEWNLFRRNIFSFIFHYKNNKKNREITSYAILKKINKERLEGWFVSDAGESSGTITLIKTDFVEIDKNSFLYHFFVFFAKKLKLSLVDNMEHHFLKLFARSKRIKKEVDIKKILVLLEDKNFFKHNGFSFKSFLRGFLSQISFFRNRYKLIKSGGSTITMQLARSLFIKDYNKKFRRKIIEIVLSFYLERILTKEQILNLYLACVRFDLNTYGLLAAKKHFFKNKTHLTIEENVFLIERLSSSIGTFNTERVENILEKVKTIYPNINNSSFLKIYKESKLLKK